jgi:hypothetical protein
MNGRITIAPRPPAHRFLGRPESGRALLYRLRSQRQWDAHVAGLLCSTWWKP